MNFIQELGVKAFVSRLKNFSDLLTRDVIQIYREQNIAFEPLWKSIENALLILLEETDPGFLNALSQIEMHLQQKSLYERIKEQIAGTAGICKVNDNCCEMTKMAVSD